MYSAARCARGMGTTDANDRRFGPARELARADRMARAAVARGRGCPRRPRTGDTRADALGRNEVVIDSDFGTGDVPLTEAKGIELDGTAHPDHPGAPGRQGAPLLPCLGAGLRG